MLVLRCRDEHAVEAVVRQQFFVIQVRLRLRGDLTSQFQVRFVDVADCNALGAIALKEPADVTATAASSDYSVRRPVIRTPRMGGYDIRGGSDRRDVR